MTRSRAFATTLVVPLLLSGAPIAPAAAAAKRIPPAGARPAAAPESVGLSPERLRRIGAAMKEDVAAGKVSGVVTLVARGGRVAHLESTGMADIEGGVPMSTDTIFRIASM